MRLKCEKFLKTVDEMNFDDKTDEGKRILAKLTTVLSLWSYQNNVFTNKSSQCSLCTSHSAYVATLIKLDGVKIDGFFYRNFM